MIYLGLLLLAYGAIVIENILAGALPAWGAPNLLLALLLAWNFAAPARLTLVGSALIGALIDLNGSGRFGPGLAQALLVAAVVVRIRGPVATDDWTRRIVATLAASVLLITINLWREGLTLSTTSTALSLAMGLLLSAITAAVALGGIPLLRRMFGRTWRRNEGF